MFSCSSIPTENVRSFALRGEGKTVSAAPESSVTAFTFLLSIERAQNELPEAKFTGLLGKVSIAKTASHRSTGDQALTDGTTIAILRFAFQRLVKRGR
jgi:hypothetical protein